MPRRTRQPKKVRTEKTLPKLVERTFPAWRHAIVDGVVHDTTRPGYLYAYTRCMHTLLKHRRTDKKYEKSLLDRGEMKDYMRAVPCTGTRKTVTCLMCIGRDRRGEYD